MDKTITLEIPSWYSIILFQDCKSMAKTGKKSKI